MGHVIRGPRDISISPVRAVVTLLSLFSFETIHRLLDRTIYAAANSE